MAGEKATLSVKETSALLGLSLNATYAAVAANELPSLRFGKRILIPRHALDKLLGQPPESQSTNGSSSK